MARGGVISRLDRRFYAAVAAPFAFACVLALGASSAGAGAGVADVFPPPPGAGIVSFPTGVGVNQASGDVFVLEAGCCGESDGGRRMVQFSANGEFVRAWGWGVATGAPQFEICTDTCLTGIEGAGDGQLAASTDSGLPQVAVDQSDGSVYVADNVNNRVQKFGSAGAFLGKFGTSGEGDGLSARRRVLRWIRSLRTCTLLIPTTTASNDSTATATTSLSSVVLAARRDPCLGRPGSRLTRWGGCMCWTPQRAGVALHRHRDLRSSVRRGCLQRPDRFDGRSSDRPRVHCRSSADFTVQGIFEFDQDGVAADIQRSTAVLDRFRLGWQSIRRRV